MADYPILFKPELVAAILKGPKRETRRPLTNQPRNEDGDIIGYKLRGPEWFDGVSVDSDGEETSKSTFGVYSEDGEWGCKCPYQVGDILWVRETWCVTHDPYLGPFLWYKATEGDDGIPAPQMPRGFRHNGSKISWRPSIHMPRWACRLRLKVTEVRCERLQDIREADAIAEGVPYTFKEAHYALPDDTPVGNFRRTWDALYASKGLGWDDNPWVWVYGFEPTEASD